MWLILGAGSVPPQTTVRTYITNPGTNHHQIGHLCVCPQMLSHFLSGFFLKECAFAMVADVKIVCTENLARTTVWPHLLCCGNTCDETGGNACDEARRARSTRTIPRQKKGNTGDQDLRLSPSVRSISSHCKTSRNP